MPRSGLERLAEQLRTRPALLLTGAGISTDSGIPDYRSPAALANPREPMRFQTFLRDQTARQHYWARSHVGWKHMSVVQPNSGHIACARLQAAGLATGVLTQNVDGLHQLAGSTEVLELHGTISQVRCLSCRQTEPMTSYQSRLLRLNPGFSAQAGALNPDGDTELAPEDTAGFQVADCLNCGGIMKTDVVFFGENVPAPVVSAAWKMLQEAKSLLVLGSSLTVRSGYRFVEGAYQQDKPVFIINDGQTRADDLALIKLEGRLAPLLDSLLELLDIR